MILFNLQLYTQILTLDGIKKLYEIKGNHDIVHLIEVLTFK